jgi:uncharacterized OB-fold protein
VRTVEPLAPCDLATGTLGLALDYRSQLSVRERPVVQACTECGRVQSPPTLRCPACRSAALGWVDGGATGKVATFVTVSAQERTPAYSIPKHLEARLPYTTVFVTLALHQGVRVAALLAEDVSPGAVKVGVTVRLSVAGGSRPVLVATL